MEHTAVSSGRIVDVRVDNSSNLVDVVFEFIKNLGEAQASIVPLFQTHDVDLKTFLSYIIERQPATFGIPIEIL